MGITNSCAKFLFFSKSYGVNFDQTLMLGRQELFASNKRIIEYSNQFKTPIMSTIDFKKNGKYSEHLFEILGAKTIDSIDFSTYEEATIIHDLNYSIPDSLKNKYDFIFDGGTLEHVFNFPVAIKNCMAALKQGGHFVSITPANNFCGHGFYQFSPELFFSLFDKKNGFETKMLFLALENSVGDMRDWYEVSDPHKVKKRVNLCNDTPTYIMVLAKKTDSGPVNELIIQQSDYENIWNVFGSIQANKPLENEKKIWALYRKYTPVFIRKTIHFFINFLSNTNKKVEGLGNVDPALFKKVNI